MLTSLDTKGGRGMLRILFGCLLLGGAMAMPAAAENDVAAIVKLAPTN